MRLLYLPNEASLNDIDRQIGPRKAFQRLLNQGELDALEVFSFLHEFRQSGDAEKVRSEIIRLVKDFEPDVIYWQHVSDFELSESFIVELKAALPKAKLIYHEADPYGRYIKRINQNMRVLFGAADLVIMSGLGDFFSIARSAGARRLLFSVQHFDSVRSGRPWEPTLERAHDVTMIANAIGSVGVPGRYFPGSRQRKQLGQKLSDTFGTRFALYGRGWEGVEASRGVLAFDQQEVTLRSGWVSVNWQHFDQEPYYFSNRIPISMAAGVPHITNYQAGYEHIFKECQGGLYFARNIEEAVDLTQYLLSQPKEFLIEEGAKAREFAFKHLETDVVYAGIVNKIREIFKLAS